MKYPPVGSEVKYSHLQNFYTILVDHSQIVEVSSFFAFISSNDAAVFSSSSTKFL